MHSERRITESTKQNQTAYNHSIGEIMKRTAIYMRVSSDKQVQEGDSISAQRDALHKYIDSRPDLIFSGEYLDDGVSGTKEDRDELQRLLSDVRNHKIDLIIATKLDRIYRSIRHYLNFQDTLDKCGVNWLAIWEPIYDTSTPQGRLIINQMMSIAQFEAENTGQRIRQVQAYKVSQGEVISGSTPPGYSIQGKHLVPNNDAEAVREVFKHYSICGNLHETMRFALPFGVFPATSAAFKNILQNPIYIGVKRDNNHFCEGIIDKELYEDVQRKLSMNVKVAQRHTYVFSGLIRCSECGNVMAGHQKHKSSREKNIMYNAYRCAKRYSSGGIRRCSNTKSILEYKMEEYLLNNIRPMIQNLVLTATIEQAPVRDNSAKITALRKKQDRLKELFVNDLISLDEYKADRERIENEISSIPVLKAPEAPNVERLNDLLASDFESLYATFTPSERRFFWRSIIQKIEFGYDRSIKITFLP